MPNLLGATTANQYLLPAGGIVRSPGYQGNNPYEQTNLNDITNKKFIFPIPNTTANKIEADNLVAMSNPVASQAPVNPNNPNLLSVKADKSDNLFGDDGFTFGDLIDILNPLQNIPVVGSVYRHYSGDENSTGSRLVGGAIYGGFFGLAAAIVDVAVEENTGKDIGGNILAGLGVGDTPKTDTTATAMVDPDAANEADQDAISAYHDRLKKDAEALAVLAQLKPAAAPVVETLPPATEAAEDMNAESKPNPLDQAALAALNASPAPLSLEVNHTIRTPRRDGRMSAESVQYLEQLAILVQKAAKSTNDAASPFTKSEPSSQILSNAKGNNPYRSSLLVQLETDGSINNLKTISEDPAVRMNQALHKYEAIQKMGNQTKSQSQAESLINSLDLLG